MRLSYLGVTWLSPGVLCWLQMVLLYAVFTCRQTEGKHHLLNEVKHKPLVFLTVLQIWPKFSTFSIDDLKFSYNWLSWDVFLNSFHNSFFYHIHIYLPLPMSLIFVHNCINPFPVWISSLFIWFCIFVTQDRVSAILVFRRNKLLTRLECGSRVFGRVQDLEATTWLSAQWTVSHLFVSVPE